MGKISVRGLRKLCMNGVISTKDYWTFKKIKKKSNLNAEYRRKPFNLSIYTNSECLLWFRFTSGEIKKLLKALRIPKKCTLPNRTKFTGQEGLCILLRRLCYPNRLSDLVPMFNRDSTTLSRIVTYLIERLYADHADKLNRIKQPYLSREKLQELAEFTSLAGCPYPNIVGFIDGTARPICRPCRNQREMYSGYKKKHVMKYQSIVLSNGLIGRLDGPFIGRRHDAAIFYFSNVREEMESYFNNGDGTWYAVYGDPGYSNQKYVKVGYKNHARLTDLQKQFNALMSSLRVGVEYGFGLIIQQFAFLDFCKNQKILLQPLKKMYVVAALLANCQSCLRGTNQVSSIFGSTVPSLDEYFRK